MKTILVTSEITYAPQNYNDVLEFVVNNSCEHIAGVVFIKIGAIKTFGKAPYLYFSGCKNMARVLMRNIADAVSGRKKILLKKRHIPFISAENVNKPEVLLWVEQLKPDIILNMRARCIYKEAILNIPRLGCVNVHHGILPEQKGLFCDLYALAEKRKTGFTIHEMTKRIDEGRIFYQEQTKEDKDYMKYLANVSVKEKAAIANFINQVAKNNFLPQGASSMFDAVTVTTTPDFQAIKRLQAKGIIL